MNIVDALQAGGFARVIVLNGLECGCVQTGSVLLALWAYQAEREPASDGAWVHPYYFASQQAYMVAADIAKQYAKEDGAQLRDDILLKPIFARLPGFSQGRNTLLYTSEFGSRFHVQTLTITPGISPTHHLEKEKHGLHCGDCRKCVEACPVNALEGGVFHRERCLRNWQLSGQPIPQELRRHMGNRLIGCDVCQRVCPHNLPAEGNRNPPVDLEMLLQAPKEMAMALKPRIGANLAIPNRVLGQACLIAGCSGRAELISLLAPWCSHPSPVVSQHAQWAKAHLDVKDL